MLHCDPYEFIGCNILISTFIDCRERRENPKFTKRHSDREGTARSKSTTGVNSSAVVQLSSPSEFPCASISERVLVQNLSCENQFDLHENEPEDGTHFHMNGFARRLILKQWQNASQKWPIHFRQSTYKGKSLRKCRNCDRILRDAEKNKTKNPIEYSTVTTAFLVYDPATLKRFLKKAPAFVNAFSRAITFKSSIFSVVTTFVFFSED